MIGLRFLWRTFFGNTDKIGIFLLPFRYRKTLAFLFRKQGGFRKVLRFLGVKLMARGERVGLQLGDPLALLGKPLFPRMLEIETTTRCRLSCPLCERTWFPDGYNNQCMTYEQFKHILDRFPKLQYVNATGEGSAYLNPDFPKMLRYCADRGLYTTVIDSFAFITEEQMRMLLDYEVMKVPISCDGATKEVYEKVRVGATFEKTVANIKRFVELRGNKPYPEIAMRFIFYRDNWQDVVKYPAFVASLAPKKREGIDFLVEYAALLEFEQTKDWVVELPQEVIDRTNASLKWYGLTGVWSHPSHKPEQKRSMNTCAAWCEPYVNISGDVLPDCAVMMSNRRNFLHDTALGNLYNTDFTALWNSDKYRTFRKMVNTEGPVPIQCAGCRAMESVRREKLYGVV